jgi:hypothetical protein
MVAVLASASNVVLTKHGASCRKQMIVKTRRAVRLNRRITFGLVVVAVFGQFAVPVGALSSLKWSAPVTLSGVSTVTNGSAVASSPLISCSSPGNCSSAGTYYDSSGQELSYLTSEVGGTWQNAVNVAGVTSSALSVQVAALTCSAPGECLASGSYEPVNDTSLFGTGTPFLDVESGGVWQPAIDVPGLNTLGQGSPELSVASCSSPGNCVVAGTFLNASTLPAFVATQTSGVWSNAVELPGLTALGLSSTGYYEAPVNELTCVSNGNCVLGGYLFDGNVSSSAYFATETAGVWAAAKAVTGLNALDSGSGGMILAIACSSLGNCTMGGTYSDVSSAPQAFVASEVNGTWNAAVEVPGTGALNTGGGEVGTSGGVFGAAVQTLSCPSDGNCTMVGWYQTLAGASDLFVDSESSGTWATASAMENLAALNAGAAISNNGAAAAGLVCASVGNCDITGNYVDAAGTSEIFTDSELGGVFGAASELPGSSAFAPGGVPGAFSGEVTSLSCSGLGECAMTGFISSQGFVAYESSGTWSSPASFVTTPTVFLGTDATTSRVSCPVEGGCTALGEYSSANGTYKIFIAQQTNGVWGSDVDLSALNSLSSNGVGVQNFTCSSAGNCSVVGEYSSSDLTTKLFSDTETNGTWATPQTLSGLPIPTKGTDPYLYLGPRWSVLSCSDTSNCTGIGVDRMSLTQEYPFVASEVAGNWTVSTDVTGSTALPGLSVLASLSCPSAGNCVALGENEVGSGPVNLYSVSETHGTWGPAKLNTSTTKLSNETQPAHREAFAVLLSCQSLTTCEMTGDVTVTAGGNSYEPFVMSEVNGVWKAATKVPGIAKVTALVPKSEAGLVSITSLGCSSATSCTMTGSYPIDYSLYGGSVFGSFVLKATKGVWSSLNLLKAPASTKTSNSTTTYYFSANVVLCPSSSTCAIIGEMNTVTKTKVTSTETDFTYSEALASASGIGSTFATTQSITPYQNNLEFSPYYLEDANCGPTGACAIAGSYATTRSTLPFVITS